jgi:hypothetical protein
MKVFMNGGRTVELLRSTVLDNARKLIKAKGAGRGTVYFKKTSDGCEEAFYSPEGLTGLGNNEAAKALAALIRKEIGCRAWVYRTWDEISGDYCVVLVGPFYKVDWRKPIPERNIHTYTTKEIFNGGKISK